MKHGVDVVLTGHDHFYERIKPQKGILYFVSGGAAKLRSGDIERSTITAKAFDTGYHFMLAEVTKDAFHFQVISDKGQTIDAGTFMRRAQDTTAATAPPSATPAKPAAPVAKPPASPARPASPAVKPPATPSRP